MHEVTEILTLREPEGGPAARGTLLLVPGRGERPEVYQRFGRRLASDAYRVHVTVDPTADPSLARAQLEETLGRHEAPAPVVLVGSDAGALFAAALAAQAAIPGLAGLIVAGLPVESAGSAVADWDAELDARTTCPTHRGRISDALVRPGALYDRIPAGWFAAAALEEVTVPILAVHGQEDPVSPLEEAREAYAAGGELELVTVAGAPHDVLNDRTHRTVAAVIVTWLERLREGAALTTIATVQAVGAGRV